MASVILAIEKKSDFQRSPPAGWRLNPTTHKTTCEDGSVTVLTTDKTFEGRSTCLEASSVEELDQLRGFVRSKPILTTVKCTKTYDTGRGDSSDEDNTTSTHTEEYIVLINVNHPQMVSQFDEAFDRAERYLRDGKKFRVTINLGESLKIWFMHNVPVHREHKRSTMAWGCEIYIAHGVGEPTCADRCFNCDQPTMICFWCICFPFFLLCFLPHLIYKKFIMGVEEFKITKPLPVTYHSGPFQMGFNLLNFFYPPGTIITTITNYQQAAPYQQQGAYQQAYQQAPYTQQPIGYPAPTYGNNPQTMQQYPLQSVGAPPASYQQQLPSGDQQQYYSGYQSVPQKHQ